MSSSASLKCSRLWLQCHAAIFMAMTSASANSYQPSWGCLASNSSSKVLFHIGRVFENPVLLAWLLTHDFEI